jgi:cystathionine beta-synthase/cysteine synthase A
MICSSVLDTIGGTPCVGLGRLSSDPGADIYLKLEGCNPGGGVKDRSALRIVDEAEREGLLRPGSTIIESSSGNFGRALAMIGAVRGYRVVIVADPNVQRSAISFYRAMGAEVEMVELPAPEGGFQRARIDRVQELLVADPENSYWPNQYANPCSVATHAETTALELLEDFPEIDVLVIAVSTGGHLSGIAPVVQSAAPGVEVVAVDAVGSAIFQPDYHPFRLRGLGLAWRPQILDYKAIDRVQLVADTDALSTARLAAREEGLLLGESASAVLFACLSAGSRHRRGPIVGIAADSGVSYLEESFDGDWLAARGINQLVESRSELLRRARDAESWSLSTDG